jgi:hypothetical protein
VLKKNMTIFLCCPMTKLINCKSMRGDESDTLRDSESVTRDRLA